MIDQTFIPASEVKHWHRETDVLVVGLGAAGASAALEAAEKDVSVCVFDRLAGGGASALSGGVIYAGGGTRYQTEAGDKDDPDNLFNYLKLEVDGAVSDQTLRDFSENSVANLNWLESFGLEFSSVCYDDKTSYPPDGHFLYYSGNELSAPFNQHATPVRRGHRTKGQGLTGHVLFAALYNAIKAKSNIEVSTFTEVSGLVLDDNKQVIGARFETGTDSVIAQAIRSTFNQLANKLVLLSPRLSGLFRSGVHRLRASRQQKYIRVKQGLILASGGFMFNKDMLKTHAPDYQKLRPLGEFCDGQGIQLGMSVGGDTAYMGKVSAWRFITPPACLLKGLIVTSQGQRVCNEDLYGATTAAHLMQHDKGQGWLVIDQALMDEAKRLARPGEFSWNQWLPARLFLHQSSIKAETLATLADRCKLPIKQFMSAAARFNQDCANKQDRFHKLEKYQRPLGDGPYYAIDISLTNPVVPCPAMTLGGLSVNERSGVVVDKQGDDIIGLYAAGRAAVGICSNAYVSGLSLADCIFSGRRAGRSAGNT